MDDISPVIAVFLAVIGGSVPYAVTQLVAARNAVRRQDHTERKENEKAEFETLRDALTALKTQYDGICDRLATVEAENGQLRAEVTRWQEQVSEWRERATRFEAKANRLSLELADLRRQYEALETGARRIASSLPAEGGG